MQNPAVKVANQVWSY